ncbi:unnamed protein product [Arabis nemorensis]|uniref:Hydroxymethylglutaryl-coenzyme A synthase C-terminal domain-containing protein n=1 Tax=Arabis nemorensis TaxID=586526 RepID=A0A565AX41_9BRAS|nr:unnamed protein product [Arabis nemorensis]
MEHRYGANDFVTDKKHIGLLPPGTYYLMEVDSMYRRFYATVAGDCTILPEKGKVENGTLS